MSTNKELGMLFVETYPPDENGFSPIALMDDLIKIDPDFRTHNGLQWARVNDGSWLGKRYKIEKKYKSGKTYSVQLVGFQDKVVNHSIPASVKRDIEKRCVILDITTNNEIDHKDARYPDKNLTLEDFQGLCKTANDAKRQHCKECLTITHKRYDATRLGYSCSFIKGNEDSNFCEGCYWYDPVAFNKAISANYQGGE